MHLILCVKNEAMTRSIEGTARSMGLVVED